jgi:hypothetical protein
MSETMRDQAPVCRDFLRWDIILCLLAAGVLSVLAFRSASILRFDYDEVAEFHAIWQVSQGHKPYVDFYYDHPPYFWLLYSPILRALPPVFESLVSLRKLDLIFSFAALALLSLLILRLDRDRSWKTCALAALGLVVLQIPVLFTFAQFRADHLALALTLAGLLALDAGGPAPPPRWALAGSLFAAAALLTPKLALIYVIAVLVFGYGSWRAGLGGTPRCLAALLAAAAAAFLAGNGAAWAAGMNVMPYFQLALRHHLLGLTYSGYRFGLARGLLLRAAYNPLLALIFICGTVAAVQQLRETGWEKNKLLIVFLGFAFLQPLWVKYLWDQYIYTVLLVWALPLALFLRKVGRWRSRLAQAVIALLFWGGVYIELPELANYDSGHGGLDKQVAIADQLLQWSPPGSAVAMQPPAHVVFRENSTYFFNYTNIPAGPGTEEVMLRLPQFQRLFSFAGYLEQLERRPPSLILVNPDFAGPQYLRAVEHYVHDLHREDYVERRVLDTSVLVRKPRASAGGSPNVKPIMSRGRGEDHRMQ